MNLTVNNVVPIETTENFWNNVTMTDKAEGAAGGFKKIWLNSCFSKNSFQHSWKKQKKPDGENDKAAPVLRSVSWAVQSWMTGYWLNTENYTSGL